MKQSTVIVKRETVKALPAALNIGAFLETKQGKVHLRLADMICARPDGGWDIERTWLKPGYFSPQYSQEKSPMLTTVDPAELPVMQCTHEHHTIEAVCPRCHRPGDAVCPHCHSEYEPDSLCEDYGIKQSSPQELAQRFARLARIITSKRNSKFWWACLLVATGDAAAGGVSMAELGQHFSVTRACVSKTCVAICGVLGLPPSRYMQSEESREVHRQNNRRN